MTGWIPWRSLGLAVAAIAVAAAPGASSWLAVERSAIEAGEVWRFLTGHLVHGSGTHLLWNVFALLGLGFLFERDLGSAFWKLVAGSSLLIGAGTLTLRPSMESYVGLSGVLNAIWAGGALVCARKTSGPLRIAYLVCMVAGLAKIVVEGFGGVSLFTDPASLGGVPTPLAHALGYLGGWIAVARPESDGRSTDPAQGLLLSHRRR